MRDKILETLNSNYSRVRRFPIQSFVNLDGQPFLKGMDRPLYLLFLTRIPLEGGQLMFTSNSFEMPIGALYYLSCSGISIGYLLEFPRLSFKTYGNYFRIMQEEAKTVRRFHGVRALLQNKDLIVTAPADDSALLIMSQHSRLVDIKRT